MKEYPFSIEACNESGAIAHDFVGMSYTSAAAALRDFDNTYNRKGFRIAIYKADVERGFEPVLFRLVKSTFR